MIEVICNATQVIVSAPYHPDFPKAARSLNGKHEDGKWAFDYRDKSAVLSNLKAIFGFTEEGKDDLVDLLVRLDPRSELKAFKSGIFLAGRCVARAFSRDSGAKTGEGVVVKEGSFSSGGSAKNWTTESSYGVVFEIQNVYRHAALNVDNMFGSFSAITYEIIEHQGEEQEVNDDRGTDFVDVAKATLEALIKQREALDELIDQYQDFLAN